MPPKAKAPETTPPAPPLVSKDNLPADELFRTFYVNAAGPFEPPVEIETADGTATTEEPVYIGVRADGEPYAIPAADFEATHTLPAVEEEKIPPPAATDYERVAAAFADGVKEGLARAAKPLPLFEAAKKLARADVPEGVLLEQIAELEAEREETLVRSDRDLILGVHRRLRAQQAQRDDALRDPGRARRTPPGAPKVSGATEYEHVQ